MAKLCDILAVKGQKVWSVDQQVAVIDAALLMREHNIGGLLVRDGEGIVGIFTERDLMKRVVAERRDPAGTRVEEVMSREVACGSSETSLEEARAVMRDRRIRHLPVMEQGRIIGIVTIGDLNAYQLQSQEQTIYMLHEYLYGRA